MIGPCIHLVLNLVWITQMWQSCATNGLTEYENG